MSRKVMWMLKSILISYIVTAVFLLILALFVYKLELGEKMVSAGMIYGYAENIM